MRLLSLALTALVLQGAQTPKPAAAPRELVFNWPVGVEATVETERSRERSGAVTSSPPATKSVQRIKVMTHPDGRLIQFDPVELPRPAAPSPTLAELSQRLAGIVPSFVVAADGSLVRVEHVAKLRDALTSVVNAERKRMGNPPQELDQLIGQLTSEQFLTQMVGQEWDVLVGSWAGLPIEARMFDLQLEAPVPLFPDTKVPMNVRAGIAEFTPCTRGGVSRQCASIESRQSIDQKAMSAVLDRVISTLGDKALQSAKYDHFDVVTVIRIRLEVETMLPHDVSVVRTTEMGVTEPNKPRVDVKQVDRRSSKFVY